MKTCLILHGHVRTFEKTIENLKKYISNFEEIDIFIHTWDTIDRLTPSYYKESNNNYNLVSSDMIEKIYKKKK